MRGADVAGAAQSPPAAAVGRELVRAGATRGGSAYGAPSTMIAEGKLTEQEPSPAPSSSVLKVMQNR